MVKQENRVYLTRQELIDKYPDLESVFYDEEVLLMLQDKFFISGLTKLEMETEVAENYKFADLDDIPEKYFIHYYEEQSVLDFLEYRNRRLRAIGIDPNDRKTGIDTEEK